MEYRKLLELQKLPNNPRLIRDHKFKDLCDSIQNNKEFFEARPLILSNRTGELVIIAGNQRYEAARHLKLKEVPTFLIEGLTEEKEREITIRDNTQQGEWDFDALANDWSDLPLAQFGVDIPAAWGNEGNSNPNSGDEEGSYKYQIIIECEGEVHQGQLLERFNKEGISCRPLVL